MDAMVRAIPEAHCQPGGQGILLHGLDVGRRPHRDSRRIVGSMHAGCWYSWSDARLELGHSSIIGGRWRAAMRNATSIIHASTEQALCKELSCTPVSGV